MCDFVFLCIFSLGPFTKLHSSIFSEVTVSLYFQTLIIKPFFVFLGVEDCRRSVHLNYKSVYYCFSLCCFCIPGERVETELKPGSYY